MQTIDLGCSELKSSRLVYGCMRIVGDGGSDDLNKGRKAIMSALDEGYTQFDHADIYSAGRCEELFGEVLRESPGMRDRIVITTKCGIRLAGDPSDTAPGRYDFSAEHLLQSVDGSLKRLGIEQIDLLLLHRPDYLFDAREVAGVFAKLKESGKVAYFGVSNFSPSRVSLLQSQTPEPLIVNQVEINLHNIDAFSDGTLDQCQQLGITPQAWSPIAGVVHAAWGNTFTAEDDARIAKEVGRQARHYGVENWLIALAWLLKHPAGISPVIGTTTPARIAGAKKALQIDYSREDWYRLLEARNGMPVP